MNVEKREKIIVDWINNYCDTTSFEPKSLVVGISGGIDSSVVSTLCALTKRKTIVLSMPIKQIKSQHDLSIEHANWLMSKFKNVEHKILELENVFKNFEKTLNEFNNEHGFANSRARLRMATLYQVAAANSGIVVGTGNKVEDFGVGFYTKYGDGGVDLSPIADLMKSEVFALAKALNINEEIQKAAPTDGLWGDDRTDEDQMGATYNELEWAMKHVNSTSENNTDRQKEVLAIYKKLHGQNQHKMQPIPVCEIPADL